MLSRFALSCARSSGARLVVVPQRNASIQEFKRRINVVKSGANTTQTEKKKKKKLFFFFFSFFLNLPFPLLSLSFLSPLSVS
jgi:hypothetical protein